MEPLVKTLIVICPECHSEQTYQINLKVGGQTVKCPNPNCVLSWKVKFELLDKESGEIFSKKGTIGPLIIKEF
ncbi:MAG: hypothetical protein AB1491_12035 [Thermodesulfobacteriota bacterium]